MTDMNRRRMIKLAGGTAVAVPLSALVASLPSQAQDFVDPASAPATALAYMETSDKEGQHCGNCALYVADTEGCPLFPGAKVHAEGWCSAYAPKG